MGKCPSNTAQKKLPSKITQKMDPYIISLIDPAASSV